MASHDYPTDFPVGLPLTDAETPRAILPGATTPSARQLPPVGFPYPTDRGPFLENDMTQEEIQAACDALAAQMVEHGVKTPRAEVWFSSGVDPAVHLWGKNIDGNSGLRTIEGDNLRDSLKAAKRYVADLPTPAERERRAFMADLGRLIDQGKAAGIDLDYLNPLSDTMKRLSGNVLEAVK